MCMFQLVDGNFCSQEFNSDVDEYCLQHRNLKCVSCGGVATGFCYQTGGWITCGEPVCDFCEHTIFPDGTNGMMGVTKEDKAALLAKKHSGKNHCKITEQVFVPWFEREGLP